MNREIRGREKVMRGFKNLSSPTLKGLEIHHNFVRPHMDLNGRTPAEAAGIQVKGENRWLTIIQNAAYPTKVDSARKEGNPTKT